MCRVIMRLISAPLGASQSDSAEALKPQGYMQYILYCTCVHTALLSALCKDSMPSLLHSNDLSE